MSPAAQTLGAKANSLQIPANKTFKPDPKIPTVENVRLIKYDFEKYGKAAERKRLLDRWEREVTARPRGPPARSPRANIGLEIGSPRPHVSHAGPAGDIPST